MCTCLIKQDHIFNVRNRSTQSGTSVEEEVLNSSDRLYLQTASLCSSFSGWKTNRRRRDRGSSVLRLCLSSTCCCFISLLCAAATCVTGRETLPQRFASRRYALQSAVPKFQQQRFSLQQTFLICFCFLAKRQDGLVKKK